MKIRVLQLGNNGVGKTFLISNYLRNYTYQSIPTVGVELNIIYQKNSESNDIKIFFWDCSGSEKFKNIIRSYYSKCDIFLIFFNANNIYFIDEISKWFNEIKRYLSKSKTFILVGNYKKNINYNLQKEIINYLNLNKMECIFINSYTDYNIILNRVVDLYYKIKFKSSKNLMNKKKICCFNFLCL